MKLHLDKSGNNLIRGYGDGELLINDTRHRGSVILSTDSVHPQWGVDDLDALTAGDLQSVVAMDPEIFILGTGSRHRFPSPAVLSEVYALGCGVEIMATGAACRTFNILSGEDRRVVAALIVD